MKKMKQFVNLPFTCHLLMGALIRLILIIYGDFHDKTYDVPYTDVDYKVFTDAARHMLIGNSPYQRHTYRYSPIVAYIMIPNVMINKHFGKILFSFFDILVTVAIKYLVQNQTGKPKIASYCSLFWLYNPLSVGISTRGNADSFPCLFIILAVLFLQTNIIGNAIKYVLSGILLAISIHLRIYPLVFSFPMYLSLGNYRINRSTSFNDGILQLIPNKNQIILALSCIATLASLTGVMYIWYGYEFLFETYIYHLFRKDTRHNFSVFFYYSYLTMDQLAFDIVKAVSQIIEFLVLFVLSLTFGCDPRTLCFALFSQAVVLVAYNSVMTSQYFIWFLSLFPLVVHNLKVSSVKAFLLIAVWVIAQGTWLFYAYLLEFKAQNVFILIWLKSVMFFGANIYVLGQLIKNYKPGHIFGLETKEKVK